MFYRLFQRHPKLNLIRYWSSKKSSAIPTSVGSLAKDEMHQHEILMEQYNLKAMNYQQLLVIQPWHPQPNLANGDTFRSNPELMLDESLGLVRTLGWTAVKSLVLRVKNPDVLFGTGQLEKLTGLIRQHDAQKSSFISAIFISTYKLSAKQRLLIESELKKPIIDR